MQESSLIENATDELKITANSGRWFVSQVHAFFVPEEEVLCAPNKSHSLPV